MHRAMEIDSKTLDGILAAAEGAQLLEADRRRLLLVGIPIGLTSNLPVVSRPRDQFISDATALATQPTDMGDSLVTFIENCARLASGTVHAAEFKQWASRRQARRALRPDRMLGKRFHIGRQLPNGDACAIWEAYDTETKRRVIIFSLSDEDRRDPSRREPFIGAAARMERLTHPGMMALIHRARADDDPLYFAGEWTRGDLRDAILKDQITILDGLTRVAEAAAALAFAHEEGMVHGDVCPESIRIGSDGLARIGPCGLSVWASPDSTRERAPELSDTRAPDGPAADVFGLARVAMFVLHGRALPGWARQRSADFLASLHCGARLRDLLRRCLDGEPSRRPSATELHAALAETRTSELTRETSPHPNVSDWALGVMLDASVRLTLVRAERLVIYRGRHVTLTAEAWDDLLMRLSDDHHPVSQGLDDELIAAGLHALRSELLGESVESLDAADVRIV